MQTHNLVDTTVGDSVGEFNDVGVLDTVDGHDFGTADTIDVKMKVGLFSSRFAPPQTPSPATPTPAPAPAPAIEYHTGYSFSISEANSPSVGRA